jgi:hypothetical protein
MNPNAAVAVDHAKKTGRGGAELNVTGSAG